MGRGRPASEGVCESSPKPEGQEGQKSGGVLAVEMGGRKGTKGGWEGQETKQERSAGSRF